MLLRLIQSGGIFSFIGYTIVAAIFGISSIVMGIIIAFPIVVIIDIFLPNVDIDSSTEIVLTVCVLFSMGFVSWILHRHLESSRPILTTKARFLKFSEGKMRGGGRLLLNYPTRKSWL